MCPPGFMYTLLLVLSTAICSEILDKSVVNIAILGDFGGSSTKPYYTTAQVDVATSVGQLCAKINCAAAVELGDNFYMNGVRNVDDPRFVQTFENVYSHPSLQIPWYVVLGNHDHLGNVQAQVNYTGKSSRWWMPSSYYTKEIFPPDRSWSALLIVLDTQTLCGFSTTLVSNNSRKEYSKTLANVQLAWLQAEIAKSGMYNYVLVAGHHPVFSSSSHGSTPCLVDKLRPLLLKYNVSAYFSGHDHTLQFFEDKTAPVSYVISGSANFRQSTLKPDSYVDLYANRLLFNTNHGYVMLTLTPNQGSLSFYQVGLVGSVFEKTFSPKSRRSAVVSVI